jgi:hypothetical protein
MANISVHQRNREHCLRSYFGFLSNSSIMIHIALSIRSVFTLPRPEDTPRDSLSSGNSQLLVFEFRLCPADNEISAF